VAPSEESESRLVVEGKDDCHAVIHLMKRRGVDWDNAPNAPYVHDAGGVEELLESISATLKNHDDVVGFVVDADQEIRRRWEQLKEHFDDNNIELPEEPPTDGFVGEGYLTDQTVGIWMMPDNDIQGTLETFLDYLVPNESESIYEFAGECVEEARAKGADCSETDHDKSQIHTWLAWQERPGMPYGQAITAEVFDRDGEVADKFAEWFRELYNIS